MGVGPDSPSPWAMQLGSPLCWRRRRGLSVDCGNETVPTDEHGRGAGWCSQDAIQSAATQWTWAFSRTQLGGGVGC